MRGDSRITRSELAFEFSEIFRDFDSQELEEVIEKNVPLETLEFFRSYAPHPENLDLGEMDRDRAPNLMLLGYLLRILEERLVESEEFDA